jgi:hypothetical protein
VKDVKLKERIENAFEAFFDDGKLNENKSLEFSGVATTFQDEESKSFLERNKTLLNILKQVFLFFPATFFTFYFWMGMMIFGPPTLFLPLFFLILISSPLLMVLGMGNIKNFRHWIMPFSVIILGSFIGIITSSIPMLRSFILSFDNAILFFPLALILAVLSKNWIDSITDKNSI